MSDYEALYACILSGQVSAAQIELHCEEKVFEAWYKNQQRHKDTE